MKKLRFNDVDRRQVRSVFVRILLPSIVLSACLSNPSVGATNTSAVGALATNWIGSFGNGLVSLPSQLLGGAVDVVTAPLERDLGIKHMPTGINGLSPRSPVLGGLDTLPLDAPYHTIVGDRGRGDTPNSSDGVVAYWSSHLMGAKSELIVLGPHGSYALPQTVSELKRILRLNLAAVSVPHRNTMLENQRSAAGPSSKRPDRLPSRDQSLTVVGFTAPSTAAKTRPN
jgi:hypothetical protein